MCLTSGEIRNNAEFQTGFLGKGSPNQSDHQAIVQFHQFHTARRPWDRRLTQCVGSYANLPSFISSSAHQDDRITREEIWGEMGANWCLSQSKKPRQQ